MKQSTNRILTTHAGGLARPRDLLARMDAKLKGEPYDDDVYPNRVRGAVAEMVCKQVEYGGGDCGFSSQATFTPEVHATVVWAKFEAEGARLATQKLWGRN